PVLRLGEGVPLDFSPDGAWVLANVPGTPETLVLYPTGAGEVRKLERGDLAAYSWGQWFRDGKRLLVCGSEPGHAGRCYLQEIAGGPPKPLTPEGTVQGLVSPDGKLVLVRSAEDEFLLYPVEGGEPRPVPWLTAKDGLIGWSTDGRSWLVTDTEGLPASVQRVDVGSGRRSLIHTLAPSDRSGVLRVRQASVSDDERSYVYTYKRASGLVFVVEGAK
ncbi:MAG TPA: hypothetical protein VLE48_11925, partial [Terriglobales bacterium]|nr:hypothetical protein [Terriglobales bacterium]